MSKCVIACEQSLKCAKLCYVKVCVNCVIACEQCVNCAKVCVNYVIACEQCVNSAKSVCELCQSVS